MKIYTKTGDRGETTLFGGARIMKDNLRVETYGTIDELSSFLGLSRSFLDKNHESQGQLEKIQRDMLKIGSDIATPLEKTELKIDRVNDENIMKLEQWIDAMEENLEKITYFILPGGNSAAATVHCARTICRRAERNLVTLMKEENINENILKYLNRLSDYLFVLGRFLNKNTTN